ncbi:MAG TPA: NADP-dependent glyceraldehyde-3-phosphate dehydrogenase [Geobacterales bacterium]|nr:NADP-dependent glyceraldehyde-3-phosphate dehydrogenase [Geobacterales bacterium]
MVLNKTKLNLSSEIFKHIYEEKENIPTFKAYIAGEWKLEEDFYEIKSPIDLNIIARVTKLKEETVNKAIEFAYNKGRWAIRDTPGEKRLRIFNKIADLLEEHREDFIEALVVGNAKTRAAANGEINASVERLRRADMDIRRMYGEYVPGDWSTESLESEAIVRREPYGLVLAITPFNYPLFDAVNKFVYSTVSANAILLKPSLLTPLPAIMFARILELAGFPKEAFSILPLSGSEMEKYLGDRRISVISLTGSSETGEKVIKKSGIKSFIMELGGGDPAIVLNDSDPAYAAARIATGITSYSGQRCDSIKLVLAESQIYESLKQNLIEEIKKVKIGDPRDPTTNMGPLISEETAIEMIKGVEDAISKGGKLLYGGERDRNYIKPTLIEANANNVIEMYLYNKEIFASVSLLVEVKDVDEAIRLANGRKYGLDAAIFGNDINKIRRLIRYLEVGTIYINDYPRHGIGYFPFGGRKESGIGREGIGYAIEYVMSYKTVVYSYKGRGIWEYL